MTGSSLDIRGSELWDCLQELLDREAIRDVLLRYCRGVDRCDEQTLLSAYHDDATDDHGLYSGSAGGWARYCIDYGRGLVDLAHGNEGTRHEVQNVQFEFCGRDLAHVESYVVARHFRQKTSAGLRNLVFLGRFIDQVERRAGEWRIAHRVFVLDQYYEHSCAVQDDFAVLTNIVRGRRDREDPLYLTGDGDPTTASSHQDL